MDSNTPPVNLEAEKAILGAIILDNQSFYQADNLTADDFSHFFHQRIYRAMLELMESGRPVDFTTLTDVIGDRKEFDDNALGVAYMTSLTDGLPRVKNITHYVDMVIKCSRKRAIIYLATSMLNAASDSESKPEQIIEKFDRKLLEIQTSRKSEPKLIRDILPEADREMEQDLAVSSDREAVGMRTGIKALDEMTTGYRRREVTVIAGETSDGKSCLLRQGVIANACDNRRQLIFSREISRERLALDFKTFMSGIYASHVRDPRKMDLLELARFKEVNREISQWQVWIDDSRHLHITDLFHKARKFIRLHRIDLIWIDYLQLIQGSGGGPTEKTENVCSGVWTLADEENVPVVALSQLNRMTDAKGKKVRPTLRRLKDSSKIEQDAHCLIFVYQPEDEAGVRIYEKAEAIIAKQRHGPTGIVPLRFNRDNLTFEQR